jgi:hypothetical protein
MRGELGSQEGDRLGERGRHPEPDFVTVGDA